MSEGNSENVAVIGRHAPGPADGLLSAELLNRVQALYDQGLCARAWQAGAAAAPLDRWRGTDAAILAGRLAHNLGAQRIAVRQHVRAYQASPASVRARAYHLELILARRGPLFAWQRFRQYSEELQTQPDPVVTDEGWEYVFTLGARISALLRDFDRSEEYFKIAARHPSKFPWLLVEQAGVQSLRERWDEALELAQAALERRPWYRQAIQHAAQSLHTLSRDEEALQLLQSAVGRLESLPLVQQFASLQLDLGRYEESLATLARAEQLSPLLDQPNRTWIAVQRCRAAGTIGDYPLAEAAARQVGDDYHQALAERLRRGAPRWRRKQVPVPFIQQLRMTCVPAMLTMLRRFWNLPADQVEVAEAICYDGTPTHRSRRWAEASGMVAREFTLTWEMAVALLDREIPFAVFTAEATSGHVQVVAGYDELRRTLVIRDPAFPMVREAEVEAFLKHYRASGPACMVLLPAGQASRIADLPFPDAASYDGLRQVQTALERHQRGEAGAVLAGMRQSAPDHWLTLTAERVLHTYDTNLPALADCLDRLLKQFPDDPNLLLTKLGCLREIGRREDRLALLESIGTRPAADPAFQHQLGVELMADGRKQDAAERALKRSLFLQPLNAYTLETLANLYWSGRRFDEALDVYRFAARLDDKKEPLAATYFSAALARRKTDDALAFLQQRAGQNIAHTPASFFTWFNAQWQCGQGTAALKELETTLQGHPEHGDLWLFAADIHGRHGDFKRAEACLVRAEPLVQRAAWLKEKADLARYQSDGKAAAALWREVLQLEPLSMAAHRSLALLLAENSGRAAALEHLSEVCGRFPHHYQLHQLWCEWARQSGPEAAEGVVRRLIAGHPNDAWARRELALVLTEAGRYQEALAEAEEGLRLAPHAPVGHATRAHVRLQLGLVPEAQADYRESIRLGVDYSPAIHGLVNSGETLEERRRHLAFIEQELVRQVVFGAGLQAFRDAARLNLEPNSLLEALRLALKARPDLETAWSAVIHQLAEMLQLDEARSLALEATQRFPLVEQAWLDLALVHRLRLDDAAERAALEQAVMVAPVSSVAARSLAHHFSRLGESARAREFCEMACARQPLDAVSHGYLALCLAQQGDQAGALERIQHAIRLQPDYAWAWQNLERWAAALGKPKLAAELAEIMTLKNPGDVRYATALARLTAGSRPPEALRLVETALAHTPRNLELHEFRAELLATLNRPAEADAACEPAIFGKQIPAVLRACRARLEARRGNLFNAIERLEAVLRENPGYVGGWQELSEWYWHQGKHSDAVKAATNIRRLDPLNAVPLGYRASLKLKTNDRPAAKTDLETAIKLDPSYVFGALTLFELQLEDSQINAAGRTLELIKRYAGGEKAKACEIKLRARYLEVSAVPVKDRPALAPERRAAELDQAFQQLKELSASPQTDPDNLNQAIQALLHAGQAKRVDQMLCALILLPNCNAFVGDWWTARRYDHGKWFCPPRIDRLCPQNPAGRRAVIKLIECLGRQNPNERETLAKALGRTLRSLALLWIEWRHRRWLRRDDHAWANMGLSFIRLRRNRAAVRWMRDWPTRPNLEMWMLFNLALALRTQRRWDESRRVMEYAAKLPRHDHTFQKLRLLLALELACCGQTAPALAHFRELQTQGWDHYMLVQFRFVESLLAVQQAPPDKKKKTYRDQRSATRELMARLRVSPHRADYRRSLARLARDAGRPWDALLAYCGF